jgi:hypothetical protein
MAFLLLMATMLFGAGASTAVAQRATTRIDVIPTITNISVVDGQLVASGNATAIVRGRPVTAPFSGVPVNLGLSADQTGAGACPILDLELGPIELNLLGLIVETSPICLRITAYQGGGLLGDLLCAVANLLDGGLTLDQILAGQSTMNVETQALIPGLNPTQIGQLLGGITELLNSALDNLLGAVLDAITRAQNRRTCDILNLALGPLDLNLLGLEVELDDCNGGPVTVDITGMRRGGLLGALLCGLLDGNVFTLGSTLADIIALLESQTALR